MRGFGHQTRLDALHDGNQARACSWHDKRFTVRCGDVQSERNRGDSWYVPKSVLKAGFRSRDNERIMEIVWVYERELIACCDHAEFTHVGKSHPTGQITLPVIFIRICAGRV